MLAGWAQAPARFREDANAEEELALGAYRDRLLVELTQNAADAAALAGEPGRVRITLQDRTLVVANTGAPLTAAGVGSLATLRASAKAAQAGAAGRFGVGFAAVRTVCDEPVVLSRTGGVRWSLADTRAALRQVPAVAAAVGTRRDALPVLRLPFPAAGAPPPGFDTAVVLPLRDDAALAAVRAELSGVDPVLLVSLPALAEIDVNGRRMTSVPSGRDLLLDDDGERTRWRVTRRAGPLDPALLADRPVEEGARPRWEVLCAVPLGEPAPGRPPMPVPLPATVPAVVRAPTPTGEPLSLPAVVAGSWPLDSTRRWVAPGPLRAALVRHTAACYADLVRGLAGDLAAPTTPDPRPADQGPAAAAPDLLDLVPTGLAAGELDAELRGAVLDALADTPVLPLAVDPARTIRPRDALAADLGAAAAAVLAEVVRELLPAAWAARQAPLAVLGVRRLDTAEVVEALAGLDRQPRWWHRLYAALAAEPLGSLEREALGALPVPLADGRLVSGPRGLYLPTPGLQPAVVAAAATLGLRMAHPEAAHPVLGTLGARTATPLALLTDARCRAAVEESFDAADPAPFAAAVLTLVAAAGIGPGELPELADLALPTAGGGVQPAGELLLPGSALAEVMAADAPFGHPDPTLLARWGPDVLAAVGVLDRFAVLHDTDVPVDPAAADHDLDGEAAWLAAVLAGLPAAAGAGDAAGDGEGEGVPDGPPVLAELVAVRDLEFVRADRWPQALALVPPEALADPAVVLLPGGGRATAAPYTRWWLARAPVLAGRRPRDLAVPGSALVGLYDPAPPDVPPALLRALGVRTDVDALLAEPDGAAELLARLAGGGGVDRDLLRRLHARLCRYDVDPPPRVAAVRAGRVEAVDPEEAVVVDAPDLLALVVPRAVVPAPLPLAVDVADTLDVALAGELGDYPARSAGIPRRVEDPGYRRVAGTGASTAYVEHAPLLVAGADGRQVRVPWRVVDGVAHVDADAGPAALGAALAWLDGVWSQRWYRAEVLRSPGAADRLAAERDLDDA